MKVLFWGTPEFALPALAALLGEGHHVVGVVTQPDRPAGRGRALSAPPVKEVALEEGLPVLQPERARGEEFLGQLRALEPDVSVVAAYGQFLPTEVLDLPPHGTLNVHPSLLPELRGAAPVQWALIRGLERTGVSVMRLVEKMDAGPVLFQVIEPIHSEESASELAARLSEIGAEALVETLALLEAGEIRAVEQDESRVTFAPSLERDDCRMDWTLPSVENGRWIRGLADVPGAWTLHRGQVLKLFRPRLAEGEEGGAPGTILDVRPDDPEKGLLVACGEGALWVREVKPSGKHRMSAAEWVRGRAAEPGERLDGEA
ncbi:MAG TPA: methionyl-tRNA formyltransferase [Longimicrobiales bacterium]|nr:methionyl-tRNA formyltransferase [Longimicrobiales bacterium]